MTQTEAPLFDPTSPSFHANRHAAYRVIRDEAPLLELPGEVPTVLVSPCADVDRVIDDPAAFDLHRADTTHLAFSGGRHTCVGAHLARLELDIAFRELVTAFPDLRLVDGEEVPREANPVFPTLRRLAVATS